MFQNKKISIYICIAVVVLGLIFNNFSIVFAAFNQEINYQGKLTNTSDSAVSNGSYNMSFRLCTNSTCTAVGDPIWTENLCYSPDSGTTCDGTGTDQRISVSSGLFSVLLGSVTSLSSINFNQTLWLEVRIGGSGSTPSWETLTPRKKLGATPGAFEAKQLGGYTWASPDSLGSTNPNVGAFTTLSAASSSASTILTVTQSGAGYGAIITGGNVGIGDTSPDGTLDIDSSATTGVNFGITNTGVYTGTGLLSVVADSATTGVVGLMTANGLSSGSILSLTSNGTAGLTDQKGLNIALSGTNGTSAQTTYGAYISNTHAGTTSTNVGLYATATGGTTANYAAIFAAGNVGIGQVSPTAVLHLKAGTATASTAPLKFTSGVSLTTAEAGAMEFTTDDLYFTITTGAARKGIVLNDGTNLTITRVPYATTNGRLTDSANLTFDGTSLTAAGLIGPLKVSSTTGVNLTATNGVLTIAGLKATGNNENLTFDFETTSNTVAIGTGTGVTTLNLNAIGVTTTGALGASTLNLTDSSNQIVLQSGGVTGTITWTPTTSNKILTIPDATTTLVGTDTTQTLTNKTLTLPDINGGTADSLTSLSIRSSGTGAYDVTIANTENLTAGRTLTFKLNDAARIIDIAGNLTLANAFTTSGNYALTLTTTNTTNATLPSGTITLVDLASSQALTTKTYNGLILSALTGGFTITGGTTPQTLTLGSTVDIEGNSNDLTLGGSFTTATAAITLTANAVGSSVTLPVSGTLATLAGTETFTNKTLTDSTSYFQDETDNTKKLQFQLSGITTGNTRTLTIPDVSGTVYVTGGTDVAVADGGTGKSSWTQWGVLYADTTTSLTNTANGTTGQVFLTNTEAAPSWGTIGASNVTADSLDFTELEDTLDLDAALTLNQGTNTWTQNFTGTTTTGLTYNADSVTTGKGIALSVDGLTTGIGLDISSVSTAGGSSATSTLLSLSSSGANSNASHETYGVYSSVANTGTSSYNYGGYFTAFGSTNVYGLYSVISAGAAATGYGLYVDAGTGAGTEYAAVFMNGKVGIGTTTPSGNLGFKGTQNNTISVDTNTVANSAGKDLTVQAGSATIDASDKNGGDTYLVSGISTGIGGSNIYFQVVPGTGAGPGEGTATIYNSAATAMTILGGSIDSGTNGNVGIGDTTPAALLTVGSGDLFRVDSSGKVAIYPNTTGTYLDFALETEWTTGTLINADFGSATTQGAGDIIGLQFDFDTNLTGTTDRDITGTNVIMNALTQSAANTTTYIGYNISAAGALTQNTAAGTINWRGLNIVLPVITQTTGTITADGLRVLIPASGAIVTDGTMSGLNVVAPTTSGPVAGTLYGIQIGALTSAGAGTETAISVGSGWDTGISVGSGGITISSGALAVNSDSITSDGATLTINAGGTVDIQDAVTVDSLDTGAGETLAIGNTNATSVSICNSAACDTITIGSNADADTITIGDSLDTGVSITDDNWSVTTAGAATFATVNTGQGAYELYSMDQNVLTTSAVQFADLTIALADGSTANIDGDGSPTTDLLQIGSGDTSATTGVDALQLTFGTSNASGNVIDITPAFAGGATDTLTYSVIDIDAFSPTNAAGTDTVNALAIGILTDPGATITSTAINIGSGWDTILGGTTAGTNIFSFTNASLTSAGALTLAGAIAANGGITFDSPTDTLGAFTANGTIAMNTNILTDIGNINTDFVASTGALNLAGVLTVDVGTTPANAVFLSMTQPASAGTRDSHNLVLQGSSYDTSGHNTDWKIFVDVTANAGDSTLLFQTRIDAAAYATYMSLSRWGTFSVGGTISAGSITTTTYTAGLCWDNSGGSMIQDCNGAPGDYAEYYGTNDSSIEAGDVVAIDTSRSVLELEKDGLKTSKAWMIKASQPYQSILLGVISTQPNDPIGDAFLPEENPRPVSLNGRVPVKVSLENGQIVIGDLLTSSSIPGVAMKATAQGRVIGMALENFDGSVGDNKILTFVNPHWYGGELNPNGGLPIDQEQIAKVKIEIESDIKTLVLDNFNQMLKDGLEKLGFFIDNGIARLKELVVEKLFAKTVRTERIEIVDKITGKVYCSWLENGEWQKTMGECSVLEPKEDGGGGKPPEPEEPIIEEPKPEQPPEIIQRPEIEIQPEPEPAVVEPAIPEGGADFSPTEVKQEASRIETPISESQTEPTF